MNASWSPSATTHTGNAKRIVSLLPAATEWLFSLGLGDRVVGVSHDCDYPADVRSIPTVSHSKVDAHFTSDDPTSAEIDALVRQFSESRTPLYELDRDQIGQLNPDLILTQTLCNVCAVSELDVIAAVGKVPNGCMLVDLRGQSFVDVLAEARMLIDATGSQPESVSALQDLEHRIARIRQQVDGDLPSPSVTLLEWVDPLFCAGHWTPELIEWAGGVDPIGRTGETSSQIRWQELRDADPDILLVACCGRDENQAERDLDSLRQQDWFTQLDCVRNEQVHLFDGSAWFNRPGPRLVDALEAVAMLIAKWHAS